jgi:hypothetical protein
LNDYTVGALEGLAYAKSILDKHFPKEDRGPVVDAYAEIEDAELKLVAQGALHFKDRLALLPKVEV